MFVLVFHCGYALAVALFSCQPTEAPALDEGRHTALQSLKHLLTLHTQSYILLRLPVGSIYLNCPKFERPTRSLKDIHLWSNNSKTISACFPWMLGGSFHHLEETLFNSIQGDSALNGIGGVWPLIHVSS